MADSTTCKSKKNIDHEAKKAMDLIEKLLKAQNQPQDLELGLQEVKKHLMNIEMNDHRGGGKQSYGGGEFSHTGTG